MVKHARIMELYEADGLCRTNSLIANAPGAPLGVVDISSRRCQLPISVVLSTLIVVTFRAA